MPIAISDRNSDKKASEGRPAVGDGIMRHANRGITECTWVLFVIVLQVPCNYLRVQAVYFVHIMGHMIIMKNLQGSLMNNNCVDERINLITL